MPIGGCAPCAPCGPSAGGFSSAGGCGSSPRGGGGGIFGGGGLFGGRGQAQSSPSGGGGGIFGGGGLFGGRGAGGQSGGCCTQSDCCSTTAGGFGSALGLDAGNGCASGCGQGAAPGGFAGAQPGGAPIGAPGGNQNGGYPPEIYGANGTTGGTQAAQGAQGAQTAGNASEFEKRLLELVNQVRKQMGLPEVQWDESLAQVARRSAQAKTHTGAPEVLAPYGYSSPEDAMNAWQQSPGHWSIITDPNYTRMGTGWVGDGAAMTFG